jgi:fibronectin type 3 domain-containing protein
VYYSFNPHFHYFRVTHTAITANSFADTIAMHTLNRRIYYKVAALDKNYNQSAFSKVATLKKPIVVPPSAPAIGQVYADSAGAHIQLIESRSEGAMGYEIYREKKGGTWKPVARLNQDWQVTKLPFTDSTITANTDYYYAAETIDSTGIHSKRSFTVHVRHHTVPTLPALNSLNAQFDKKHNTVELSWKYKKKGNYFFIIYRGIPNRPLVPWHSYDKGTRSGEDNPVNKGIYRYAIQIVNRDKHMKSVLGKPVRVAVP